MSYAGLRKLVPLPRPVSSSGTLECNLGRYQSLQRCRLQVLLHPEVQSPLVLLFTVSLKEDSRGIHFIPKSSTPEQLLSLLLILSVPSSPGLAVTLRPFSSLP